MKVWMPHQRNQSQIYSKTYHPVYSSFDMECHLLGSNKLDKDTPSLTVPDYHNV